MIGISPQYERLRKHRLNVLHFVLTYLKMDAFQDQHAYHCQVTQVRSTHARDECVPRSGTSECQPVALLQL